MTPDEQREFDAFLATSDGDDGTGADWWGIHGGSQHDLPWKWNIRDRYSLLGVVREVPGWERACVAPVNYKGGDDVDYWVVALSPTMPYQDVVGPTETIALLRAAKRAIEVMAEMVGG
tara:strand:+ start:639 stop:992 length:354 start_codon:yes stop_codon:yes gene_type:complete